METLLIVDHERRSRRQIYSLLKRRYAARAVHGISAAFKSLKRCRPDVIVVKTSGGDGLATHLLEWLLHHGLRIPTIVLLDHGAVRDGERIHRLGASHILHWPPRDSEVLKAVASLNGKPAGDARGPAHGPAPTAGGLAEAAKREPRNGDDTRIDRVLVRRLRSICLARPLPRVRAAG